MDIELDYCKSFLCIAVVLDLATMMNNHLNVHRKNYYFDQNIVMVPICYNEFEDKRYYIKRFFRARFYVCMRILTVDDLINLMLIVEQHLFVVLNLGYLVHCRRNYLMVEVVDVQVVEVRNQSS